MLFTLLSIVVCAYLLGSIPNGFLLGKLLGTDLRQVGSGNIGATNAFRFLGKQWGILVFVLDFCKGLGAVLLAEMLAARNPNLSPEIAGILGAICSILGHNFPIWLGFKGGKGIATSAGVLAGLLPFVTMILVPIWIIVLWATRYVSKASIAVAIALPILTGLNYFNGTRGPSLFIFAIIVGALAIWRHRDNLARLRAGTEHRIGRKKSAQEPEPEPEPELEPTREPEHE